jgi:hypothetical protein
MKKTLLSFLVMLSMVLPPAASSALSTKDFENCIESECKLNNNAGCLKVGGGNTGGVLD